MGEVIAHEVWRNKGFSSELNRKIALYSFLIDSTTPITCTHFNAFYIKCSYIARTEGAIITVPLTVGVFRTILKLKHDELDVYTLKVDSFRLEERSTQH